MFSLEEEYKDLNDYKECSNCGKEIYFTEVCCDDCKSDEFNDVNFMEDNKYYGDQ